MNTDQATAESRPSLAARLNRLVRSVMVTAALVAALAAAAYFYARHRADEEIRAYCEAQFQEHYAQQGLTVSLGYARLAEGQGIELRDLKILDPSADAPQTELVHIDQIFVYANVHLQDLLTGAPPAEHLAIHRLRLRAARQIDGVWNTSRLLPMPKCDGKSPTITIDDAVVRIDDAPSGRSTSLNLREINLVASPDDDDSSRLRVSGTFSSDHVRLFRVDGVVDAEHGTWSLGGSIEELKLSNDLYEKLPRELRQHLGALVGLKGQATLQFTAARQTPGQPVAFSVKGDLEQAHLTDSRLPYPLTDIVAQVYADNHQLEIKDLKARCGAGTLQLSARQDGLRFGSPVSLKMTAWRLPLEERLAEILPADMQETWRAFKPAGPIDLHLDLAYDGVTWTPDVTIDCHGTSFAYYRFPYRITNCVGRMRLVDDVLTVDATGAASGRPIHFDAKFQHPGSTFTGGGVITLDGAVPIDEEFLASLDAPTQQVVRSLHPRGMITFAGRFGRTDPHQPEVDVDFDIGLRDCFVRCEKFPYPIERIRGLLKCKNKSWEFRDLEGRNDSGYIVCDGSWEPGEVGGLLKMNFVGTDVPLEDELRNALGEQAQRAWNNLRPRGTLDHLKIDLEYATASQHLTLDVTGQKWKQRENNPQGRGITVEPVWFPYRLENVAGALHFRDGKVELTNLSGEHGKTTISLSGVSTVQSDGGWRTTFQSLAADRVEFDHELLAALPSDLGDAVRQLNLEGPINLLGSVELSGAAQADRPPAASWDLSLDMENGSLDAGLKLDHIHGGVRLQGSNGAAGFQCRGALAVDSAIYHNVQLTQLSGPLWIDKSRVLFGSWSSQAAGGAPEPLKANVFGGVFSADAEVSLTNGEFNLQASLNDGELSRLSEELTSRRDAVTGKVSSMVELSGASRGTHTWRGKGMVRLRSADIYELPVMLAVLKVLSMQRPDKTAFNSSDIDFRIQGEHLYFDRINFTGDAITLKGAGWMNLDKQIDLDFYTLVGKDRVRIPIITPALGLMSRELMLIHAGGSLDSPQLSRKTFPGLNERLKQLFPEVERPDAPAAAVPAGPVPGVAEYPHPADSQRYLQR